MFTTDPHENEYLAAVAGMADHTPSPVSMPAEGDFVSGCTAGRVEWVEGDRLTVDVGGAWLAVSVHDITH